MLPENLPAPTASGVPLRLASFATLTDALDYAAQGDTGFNFHDGRGNLSVVLPYRVLRERARDLARRLGRFARGSRVALVAHTHPDFAVMLYACQYAALVPVPLPAAIHLGGHEAYVRHLRQMMLDCEAVAAFAPAEFAEFLDEAAAGIELEVCGTLERFMALEPGELPSPPSRGDLAYLQYTSGSTRFPRGAMITQAAVMHNLEAIFTHGFRLTPDDRFCSWLPFYHDMGLVGIVLGCVTTQRSVDFLCTRDFAMRPRLWLKLISQNGCTISFSPPFGYALCARRLRAKDVDTLDLSRWRVAGVGAEMIRPEWLHTFAEVLKASGFSEGAFLPCYGMAEFSLAISFAPVGAGPQADRIDSEALSTSHEARPVAVGSAAKTSEFMNCGRVLPGFEVEIRDERGRVLGDRRCGRIFLRGASAMIGYFGNAAATREVLSDDGWLDTGDLGYQVGGALHITGRAKDVLIINGRNIWPQDLEHLAEQQPEIRANDTSGFSVTGPNGEEIAVLVVQCRQPDPAALASLVDRLREIIQAEFGINCLIELVPPHTLPRTSSGKLSRSTARKEFLQRHSEERLRELPRCLVSEGRRARGGVAIG